MDKCNCISYEVDVILEDVPIFEAEAIVEDSPALEMETSLPLVRGDAGVKQLTESQYKSLEVYEDVLYVVTADGEE